jgi:hypothetical protein
MAKPRQRFAPIRVTNKWVIEYPIEPSGVLRIDPCELRAGISFDFTRQGKGGDIFSLLFRLADEAGRVWEARLEPSPRLFVEALVDLSRKEPAHFEQHAPALFRRAFKRKPVLQTHDMLDDRFYRYFVLDDMAVVLNFKYQAPAYTLVVLDQRVLLVREEGFFCCWNRHHVPAPGYLPSKPVPPVPVPPTTPEDEEKYEEWVEEQSEGEGDYDHPPPVVYTLRLRDFLLADRIYPQEGGSFAESDIPRLLTFRRVPGKGVPQPAVAHHTRHSSPDGVLSEVEVGRSLWVELENDPYAPEDPHSLEGSARAIAFATTDGGDLVLHAPRLAGELRLGFKQRSVTRDVLAATFRVADGAGQLWESEALFTPEVFVERLADLERIEGPAFESSRPPTRAFEECSLLSGVRDTLDDGGRRMFVVDGSTVVDVTFRHQRPVYDVTDAGEKRTLLVRVSGLTGRCYPARVDASHYFDVDVSKHTEEEVPIPPIVFELAPRHLIFRNTTFAVDDGFWHDNDLPIPLVFRRVPGKGEAREGVTFRPHEESKEE